MNAPRTENELIYAGPPVRPPAGDRLRTVRTLVIAVVVMWVVLVAAWALDRGLRQSLFGQYARNVEEARRQLASVEDLSSVFAEVNTAVEPSVVKLEVFRVAGRTGPFGRPVPEANSGSGVIIEVDASQGFGYLLTNNHVVVNANRIAVTLSDGRTVQGTVIGTDPESDLAVVVIEAENLIAAEWGDSDTLRKGDWVLAFGSPFNFVGSMTAGIVSALNRTRNDGIDTPIGMDAYYNFIQVDAAVNPGNSGGPLANLRGQIVGINTAIFSKTGEFSGIGFAIPSNQARRVYEDIRESGRFIRGWLGVRVLPTAADPRRARQLDFDGKSGVIVETVYQHTPAAEAGLRRNDIILSVNGRPVRDEEALKNMTAFSELGEEVKLEVFRDGETTTLPVTIGPMPDDSMTLGMQPQLDPRILGIRLEDDDAGNVRVRAVVTDSPAFKAGIRPGDLILAIGEVPVRSAKQAEIMLTQVDPRLGVEMLVAGDGRVHQVVVKP